MRADAELAAATMAGGSFLRTSAILYLGMAHLMAGDPDKGRCPLRGRDRGGPARIALHRGDRQRAREELAVAREIEQILLQRPDLGVLVGQTEELRARLTKMRGSTGPARRR
jgi:hypothetical protein